MYLLPVSPLLRSPGLQPGNIKIVAGKPLCSRLIAKSLMCLLILACSPAIRADCECEWQGPFSWLVDDADSIVLGRVVSSRGNSFDLKVMSTMKGETAGDTIRVWGERGDLCRPDVALFPPGSQWLFALELISEVPPGGFSPGTPNISYGRPGDYALSKCGAYWLEHSEGELAGNITSVYQWDYAPEMNPVPLGLIQAFIDGDADYADIIGVSDEVTSKEAWMRRMRQRLYENTAQ